MLPATAALRVTPPVRPWCSAAEQQPLAVPSTAPSPGLAHASGCCHQPTQQKRRSAKADSGHTVNIATWPLQAAGFCLRGQYPPAAHTQASPSAAAASYLNLYCISTMGMGMIPQGITQEMGTVGTGSRAPGVSTTRFLFQSSGDSEFGSAIRHCCEPRVCVTCTV